MEMILDSKQLNSCCERIDVKDGLYTGWDIDGYPIELFWDNRLKVIVKITRSESEINKLKEAILNYAKLYRPKVPFMYFDHQDNIIELFKAAEEHIKAGRESFTQKLRHLFKTK